MDSAGGSPTRGSRAEGGEGFRLLLSASQPPSPPRHAWLVIHEHLPALLLPAALLSPPNYFHAYLIDVKRRLRIFLFLLLTISSQRRKIESVCLSYYSDA